MQTGVLLHDLHPVRQRAGAQHGDDGVPLLAVAGLHAAQVLLIAALRHEFGQSILLEARHRAGVEAQLLPIDLHESGRQDHVADADGGGDGLGEGVQVDDPLGLVDGEQRGDGTAHEAELAVVVILQYPASLLLLRPVQQLLPPSDGHDDAVG